MILRALQRVLAGPERHLRGADVSLCGGNRGARGALGRLQTLLSSVERRLCRADLCLGERGLLGSGARGDLCQVGLLLVERGLRLVNGGLKIGRIESRERLAGGHPLPDADVYFAQLARAVEAQRHADRVGDRASCGHAELQPALTDRGGVEGDRLLIAAERIARYGHVRPAQADYHRQADQQQAVRDPCGTPGACVWGG